MFALAPRRPARRPFPGWPWWLLVVAWVGVNNPQAAFYAVADWVSAARHFSHQERLAGDVAALLAPRSPAVPLAVQVASATSVRTNCSAFPAEAVLKKIELPPLATLAPIRLARFVADYPVLVLTWPKNWREAPPHGPPRSVAG
jgi:hypothetical protein